MADKKQVLVVDDAEMNRKLISNFLKIKGYEVVCAEDGLKALKCCSAKNYDLVFTDIEMPNMNGIEFLRSAKRNPVYGTVPFVVLSTLDTDVMRDKAKSFGAFYYMVKPFNTVKMDDVFKKLGW